MTWWCAASNEPWSWSPRLYPGIWIAMAALLAVYLWAWHRYRPQPAGDQQDQHQAQTDERRRWAFVGGWLLLWGATDWPLGTLGSGYLASAHMAQYVLYTMAAAPLLILGTPEWMARRLLSKLRLYRVVRTIAHPVAAGVIFNLVMIGTHAPITVDAFRVNQVASFGLDVLWLAAALLLWLPVCGPLPELKPSLPARGVYLFLAAGIVPMIPAGFLTFASSPLYAVYELAPRVGTISAIADQQAAGATMKVGNMILMWPVLAGLFICWAQEDRERAPATQPARPSGPTRGVPARPGASAARRGTTAGTPPR